MASGRDFTVDLARGLACVLMVQTHAFDGWVRSDLRGDPLFGLTRWLGSFPLPGFLLLAGVSVALRLNGARRRGELGVRVRSDLVRRALAIVAAGYTVSVAWALLDGGASLDTLLRADVLHVIGLSLLLVAGLMSFGRDGQVNVERLSRTSLVATGLLSAIAPLSSRMTQGLSGPLRYLVAPFSEVRGVTVMPVLPLAAWTTLGVAIGLWLFGAHGADVQAPASRRRIDMVGAMGLVAMLLGSYVTAVTSAYLHEPLSRTSFALWPNIVEGAGRGLCLLWCGGWLAARLPARAQRALSALGVASLWVYVAHVPFAYGRLAGPLRASLSLGAALQWVLVLLLGCSMVALVRARWRAADHRRAT